MSLPLIEKYRPTSFEEVVGVKDLDKLQSVISDPKNMPNLLFYGPQGTGKTSCAKIIVEELSPIDVKKINGSDTTGVDTIRNEVYSYITSLSSEQGKPKLIWIEEFDFMSQSAFAALRAMIEQYMKNARFIVTCNYIEKIPEPIQSRFSCFEFKKSKAEDIFDRMKYIVEQENISVDDDILLDLIRAQKGDIRGTLNKIQLLSSNGEKEITDENLSEARTIADEVFDLIKKSRWSTIRYEIPLMNPDYNMLLVQLDELFFNSELEVPKKANLNEIIARGQYEMSFSFDKDICFSAICSRLIRELNK